MSLNPIQITLNSQRSTTQHFSNKPNTNLSQDPIRLFIEKLLTPNPKPEHLKDPIKDLRAKLNEDFSKNAKIKNVVFWLLYIVHPILPFSHAEVQVGNERISVANEINTVHDVNPRTRNYHKGCPYLAIGLIVSPAALQKIE